MAGVSKEPTFKFYLICINLYLNLETESVKYFPIKNNFIVLVGQNFIFNTFYH